MTVVLNVIVVLLKCIGFLLLGLLGLILLVTLLGLLVPVRYRGKLRKREAPEEVLFADGLVSWLNPLVRVRIRYTEKKLSYAVRLLGISVLNSEKPKKEKPERKRKEKKEKHAEDSAEKEDVAERPESGREEQIAESAQLPDVLPEESEEAVPVESASEDSGDLQKEDTQKEDTKKESFFVKIKKFFEKVKAFPGKLKEKAIRLVKNVKLLWHKKEKVIQFLQDEFHKQALGTAWSTVKKAFRHILPGKVKGHLEFGTGDPESTGKALGVLGILYAWYGKGITVVPDFYEKRIVADLTFKGRIRFGTLLVMFLSLIRDKQVKRFRKNWKKLFKVLKQKVE